MLFGVEAHKIFFACLMMSSSLNMLLRIELRPTYRLLCSPAWSWSAQATVVIQACYFLSHSYCHFSLASSYFFCQCLWHCCKITFYIFHNFWLATVCPSGKGFLICIAIVACFIYVLVEMQGDLFISDFCSE